MTIESALRKATTQLEKSTDSPRLDAEVLLSHVVKQDRASLLINGRQTITPAQSRKLSSLILKRTHHVPIPYLTGQTDFFGLTLKVTPAVLVPRPFTELLVEHIIPRLRTSKLHHVVADIGTGSGAIALVLASQVPSAQIIATDISASALRIAKHNARQLGLSGSIKFQQTSLLKSLQPEPDVIIANLPYLTKAQLREPSIRREPRLALDGGRSGIGLIRQLVNQARQISPLTTIVLEFDPAQYSTIRKLLRAWSPSVLITPISDGRKIRGLIATKTPRVLPAARLK